MSETLGSVDRADHAFLDKRTEEPSKRRRFLSFYTRSIAQNYWMLFVAVMYVPLLFLGYGTDSDTYEVLEAIKKFLNTISYTPSRNPGYLVHEASTLVLSRLGGSVLSNAGTLCMSMFAVSGFRQICEHFRVPHVPSLTLLLIVHPVFWKNSTYTIDYLWALGFILVGFSLFLRESHMLAGVCFGLSIGARLSSFVAVGCILIMCISESRYNRRRVFVAACISVLLGALCYVPSFANAHWTLAFLSPSVGESDLWSLKLRLGRFIYKNIYFWGLQASVLLSVVLVISVLNHRSYREGRWYSLTILSLFVIAGYELLYLQFPLDQAYLLPMLPFFLFMLGIGLRRHARMLAVFTVLVTSYNIISFNIAAPDRPSQATGASFGFWIEDGYLVKDIKNRLQLRTCDSMECFNAATAAPSAP
jgi:hypothetical protein